MVALDWTTADLQAWEEEQRKKKEEEERHRKEAEAEAARIQAEAEAALMGTTAPVYGSPQLAPAQAYTPPATGLTSVAQAAPDTTPPPPPAPEATGIVPVPAEAALPEQGGTYVSQGTPMDAQPVDMEALIYAQRQEPAYESTATATNWVTNTEQANLEAPKKKKSGGLLGVIGDVADAVGDVPLNAAQALPVVGNIVTAGRTAVNAVPGRDVDTVGDAARLAATDTDLPIYSGIARNYLIPGVAGAANAQNPLTWFDNPLRGLAEGASALGANVAVPTTARDVALTAIPAGIAAKQGGVAAGLAEAFGPGLTSVKPLEALPAAALRSVTEVPQNAPEALRVAQRLVDNPGTSRIEDIKAFAQSIGVAVSDNVQEMLARIQEWLVAARNELSANIAGSKTADSILGDSRILAGPRANANIARETGYNPTQIARDVIKSGAEAGLTGPARIDPSQFAKGADEVAAAVPSFPRLADESDIEYAVRLRTSGFAPADIKAIEQSNAQKVGAQIAQEQADRSTMYQKVGHDTKQVKQRATKISDMMDKLKAAAADETGAVRLPDRVPTPPPKVYEVGASDAGAKQLAFGEGFTADNPSALSRFAANVKAVPSALKSIQTSGDVYGFQFRQGAPSLFIDPKAWGRNFSRMGKAYLEDPQAVDALKSVQAQPRFTTGEVLKDVIDAKTGKPIVIKPMAEVLDQFQTPGMEKLNDSFISNVQDAFPLAKRSEKSMRVGYLGLANDLRNSMIDDAVRAGVRDQSWFDHYDDIAKVTVGYGDVPKQLKGLSDGFYSLRNIAARFQMLTKPITEPGPLLDLRLPGSSRAGAMGGIFSASPRGVSARNLTRFAAGEIANLRLLAFAGEHSGLFEVGWNPLEPGFGSLQFGDGEGGGTFSVDLLGGWSSYIKMLSKTAAAAAGDTRFDPFEEQVKFWRYKAGPAASMVLDTLVDVTSLGDLEAFDSPFAKPITKIMDWKPSDFAEMFSPFFVGAAVAPLVDGVLDVKSPTDLLKVGGLLGATWGGAPANYYEPSVFTLAPEIFDGREFTELDGAERAVVNQALLQQGGKLEGWQRVQPYDRADDDGFEAIKARTPELQQYKDLKTFRAEMERAIIQEATARGITLESQDVDTKRKALEKKLGLPGETDPRHALVVAIDPEIISQMQAMYDSGERTFPPSKEMRTFAEKVKAMSDADRKELIRQLEERLDAAP